MCSGIRNQTRIVCVLTLVRSAVPVDCGDPEEIVYCEKYFESPRDSLDVTVHEQIMTLTCCGKGKEV